jgi:Protein of unknown function (DUF2793)
LAVSQAHKEITHNEALVLIDALLHPVVEDELSTAPSPLDTDIGKCWLVGPSASGQWSGKDGDIAIWVGGSWRFLNPKAGMGVRMATISADKIWSGTQWIDPPPIAVPAGGSVIDVEARQTVSAMLAYFRSAGQFTA